MRAIDKNGKPWRLYQGAGGLCAQGEPAGYCGDWEGIAPLLEARPDPGDPATLGALLGAVEAAWHAVGVVQVVAPVAAPLGEPWRVRVMDQCGEIVHLWQAPTRFEALMTAHEAAP